MEMPNEVEAAAVPAASEKVEETATEKPAAEVKEAAVEYTPVEVSIKSMISAGAHFGHQAARWNPKMMPYIYSEKNGIHIINLDVTEEKWAKAQKFLAGVASRGGNVLFVGTKTQARSHISQAAERSGAYHITSRWLGGLLSNFQTIKKSISRMRKMEELLEKAAEEDSDVKLNKKERLGISRDLKKLDASLGGIRMMKTLPDALFVIDINKESIAVSEAHKLHIPIVALVDTNTDPALIQYPIPANDDASRTIALFANAASDAIAEGRARFNERMASDSRKDGADKKSAKTSEVEVVNREQPASATA